MQPEHILNLKPGDRVDVKYGGNIGRQQAIVVGVDPLGHSLKVRKYRTNSRSWTGVVRVLAEDVLERRFISVAPAPEVMP